MKRVLVLAAGTAIVVALAIAAAGCGDGNGKQKQASNNVVDVDANGNTSVSAPRLQDAITAVPVGQLTQKEKDGLAYMREEEKLARDVYQTLYSRWQIATFANIASSEQTHADAVLTLLQRYSLADPAAGKSAGQFTNADLQRLYDDLAARGAVSANEALTVGALIEDLDIVDLDKRLSETDKPDIRLVYENLQKGSRNHLRSFVKVLERSGGTYTPTYLTPSAYEAIISSPMEQGAN